MAEPVRARLYCITMLRRAEKEKKKGERERKRDKSMKIERKVEKGKKVNAAGTRTPHLKISKKNRGRKSGSLSLDRKAVRPTFSWRLLPLDHPTMVALRGVCCRGALLLITICLVLSYIVDTCVMYFGSCAFFFLLTCQATLPTDRCPCPCPCPYC
ncbi:hypothetical protein F4777DRAFT_135864 [Nemania sp. FL0916]|nr:hypothetical protein F4777DRAFT_135864 [Nemania sp. FL0916]